ncbi:MAG: TolC family protein [Desulfobacterales bacterium]|jgi:cobalt-zinc-cadmium efflux system outer membrane protein|nr:TolC family protein [Desulfobacterales bacterium]
MIVLISRRGRLFLRALIIIIAVRTAGLSDAMAEKPSAITLNTAIETALLQRPEPEAFSKDILAAKGRVTQSATLPNPELGLETSSLGDEDSVVVSQAFEFARKRAARVKAAEAEIPLVENDRLRTRLDIINEVSQAFITLLGAQEKGLLVQAAYDTAQQFAATVTERAASGAISPIEETRAKVLLAGALTDLARAGRELENARLALAAAMGTPEARFTAVEGRIPTEPTLPDKSALVAAAGLNPDLTRWKLERDRRSAIVESELAAATPDITFSGKLSVDRKNDETAFIAGLSIPLPLFNQNLGGIMEARAELDRSAYGARSEELRVRSEIEKRHAALQALAAEAGIVRDRMLSFAQQAYDAVSEGYRLGKFRYLDVLDATKELTGAKLRHLDLLISFELEKIAMNRLVTPPQDRFKGESK